MTRTVGVLGMTSIAACLVGCGGNDPHRCLADYRDLDLHTDCLSAKELARRDSADLVVAQEDLDWYLDVYQRGYIPLSDELGAPPAAAAWSPSLTVVARAQDLTVRWVQGTVVTGVPAIDLVFERAHIDTVTPQGGMPATYFGFTSSTHVVVNPNVAVALQGVSGLEVYAEDRPPEEGVGYSEALLETPRGTSNGVDIVYRLGWGSDCIVGCAGQVSWRVHVTDDSAQLVARWVRGEPPPPDIVEFWRQGHSYR